MSSTELSSAEVAASAAGSAPRAAEAAAGARPQRSPRPGGMRRLLSSELRLVFRRRRNQALLVVLAGPPILIGVAVKAAAPRHGDGPAFLGQITGNGLFLVY